MTTRDMVPVGITLLAALLGLSWSGTGGAAQEPPAPRVFVASSLHGWLHLIDPATNRVTLVLRDDGPGNPGRRLCRVGAGGYSDLAAGEGRLWAVAPGEGVCGIDPSLGAPGLPVQGQPRADRAAAGGGSLWTAQGYWVTRVDPATGAVTDSIPLDYDRTAHLAIAGDRVWISANDEWDLFHLPVAGSATPDSLRLGGGGASLASGLGSLWAYGPGEEGGMTVWRLDPASGGIQARIAVPLAPEFQDDHALAVGEGGVWIGLGEEGAVVRVDPETNTLTGSVDAGEWVVDVATGAGSVWILTQGDVYGHALRVDPVSLEVLARITIDDGVAAIAVF